MDVAAPGQVLAACRRAFFPRFEMLPPGLSGPPAPAPARQYVNYDKTLERSENSGYGFFAEK